MTPRLYETVINNLYVLAGLMVLVFMAIVLVCLARAGWRAFNRVLDHMTYGRWRE